MRITAMLLVMVSLSGCAHSLLGPTQKERQAIKEQEEETENDQREAVLIAGISLDKFKEVWGIPDQTGYVDGEFRMTYADGEQKIILGFKENKLSEWSYDQQYTVNQAARRQQRAYEAQQWRSNLGAAISAGAQNYNNSMQQYYQNSMNRQRSCSTTPNGTGGFNTNCF